ncbi:Fe-S cluster assembly ATPase SufC [Enterocloster citroniae]|uniref:Fe-S cluster assembly ATPase SufC n=1 Tax=Enterocloster citroniae TaxID=358743 RepID=UPI00349E7EA8
MSNQLLEIKGLSVHVEDKEILHGIDLEIKKGETHVLMGPNGAGKSTLGYALMGNPRYEVTAGAIRFQGKEITREAPDKRAREGMFLSFQNPVEVPGLTLGTFIRNAMEQRRGARVRLWDFRKELEKAMELLQMDRAYGDRDLNAGFSGGEKKKAEILQMLLLKPSLAILDETDSGLDVDAVRTVSQGVKEYQKDRDGGLLIITHSTRILESLQVDKTHIMVDGRIVKTGDASLVEPINRMGFEQFLDEADQNSLCPERMEDSDGRKNICR